MVTSSIAGSNSVVPQQIQTAVTKTAFDVQKQEGENAVDVIQTAVDLTQQAVTNQAVSPTGDTGTNIDVTA